ncbi:hypothetical protein RHSIM_Rhsim11G0040000 [Rhododendron simsii]|uniref:F-box/kelch-repeat protein n=1 Tax=Rhododendron simsii TaxID=118357 RepID=A0A834G5T8_RHOSS|nr:hypothetical protein RHSIM_Rhsim11G0040000 [Rhododendron simsii]
MAELGRLTCKRKKEEVIVKCVTSSVYPVYEKTLCLCVAQDEEPHNPREWYMLKISSEKDKEKEAEEKLAKKVCQITDAELRGAYLAFHHDDCHQAVVGLNGNLYVMGFDGGGASLDVPSVWGEFLDTRLVGEGHAEWSALPDPPSTLGSKCLFAAALSGDFLGKILVLNLYTYAMCLYDVTEKSWESLDPIVEYYSRFTGPPVAVGTNLYWIRGPNVWMYDLLKKALVSLPIGDSKICWLIKDSYHEMRPTLVHLA